MWAINFYDFENLALFSFLPVAAWAKMREEGEVKKTEVYKSFSEKLSAIQGQQK